MIDPKYYTIKTTNDGGSINISREIIELIDTEEAVILLGLALREVIQAAAGVDLHELPYTNKITKKGMLIKWRNK